MNRLLVVLALPLLLTLACRREQAARPAAAGAARPAAAKWHCPMHPTYVSDRPGACPICGMDLIRVPVKEHAHREEGDGGPAGLAPVAIDPRRRQLIGLKTAEVVRASIATPIRTIGRVTYDETRVHHVHTRYEAYVERLHANFTGKYVRKGEPLASLYSPELLAAEQEYLLALAARARGTRPPGDAGLDLAEAARQKLLLWNISRADVAALEKSGKPSHTLDIYAPMSGYVVSKVAVHGMRVRPEDSLFDIVDLSRMWVLADVYEYELPRIKIGLGATMTLSYWPEKKWEGKITYIFPSVDPKTRTLKVRLEVENPSHELKAEMFADVLIEAAPREALVVPDDAVVETGTRKVVFLSLGEGRLVPREIVTGGRREGLVEVRRGLSAGDVVAAGASFLLDSESRLRSAISQMTEDERTDGPAAGAGKAP